MMAESDAEAHPDTEAQPETEASGASATSDLDQFFREWEQSREDGAEEESDDSAEETPDEASEDDSSEADESEDREDIGELRHKAYRAEAQQVINHAIGTVQEVFENADFVPPDDLVDAFLIKKLFGDEAFKRDFLSMREPPDELGISGAEQWRRRLVQAGHELRRQMEGMVDQRATDDREVVASAVKAAARAPAREESFPSADELNEMSDAEFNRLTRQITGR